MNLLRALAWPFTVKVGWYNRLLVIIGTFSCVAVRWMPEAIVLPVVWVWIYQSVLVDVYLRGQISGAMQLVNDFKGFTSAHEEFHDVIELEMNKRWVAVEDLRNLSRKYNIPFEEVRPIIERGYGMQIVESDRPDDD